MVSWLSDLQLVQVCCLNQFWSCCWHSWCCAPKPSPAQAKAGRQKAERKRFVRLLSCLNKRLPGKHVGTFSVYGTKGFWVKTGSFSPHELIHELPFFSTTFKNLALYPSLPISLSEPDTWSPFSFPYLSAIHNHCKRRLVTWDGTVDCHAHARAGTHIRAGISGCICTSK